MRTQTIVNRSVPLLLSFALAACGGAAASSPDGAAQGTSVPLSTPAGVTPVVPSPTQPTVPAASTPAAPEGTADEPVATVPVASTPATGATNPSSGAVAAPPVTTPPPGPPAARRFLEVGWNNEPSNDAKALILTFDDGPDEKGHTAAVLDALKALGVHATFFINTNVWTPVDVAPGGQALVRRMVAEGHTVGNHTVDHLALPTLTDAQIESEFAGVERTWAQVMGASAAPLTLVRAPFGQPFQLNTSDAPRVGAVVAKHGVHIGWSLDAHDDACTDSTCVVNNIMADINAGKHGIMLLHAAMPPTAHITAEALGVLVPKLRALGYHFINVEDVVKQSLGQSSAALMAQP